MIKKFDKLVRDKIPSIVHGEGSVCIYEVCQDTQELREYTKKKILEEALEVVNAIHTDDVLAELGDLLAIMMKLAESYGIKQHEVILAMVQKEQRCGKFDNNFILKEIRTNE